MRRVHRWVSVVILAMAGAGVGAGIGASAGAQQSPRAALSAADSALVGSILLAEDRRDSLSPALRAGLAHGDARIQTIARRAVARIGDAAFVLRDSFAALPAPPAYNDPAWRLRLRGLPGQRQDCNALRAALSDSAWPVRFRAAALAGPQCASDAATIAVLRGWASGTPRDARRTAGGVSWHAAAHGVLALARIAPAEAREPLARHAGTTVPWLRVYVARAAGAASDTALLRRLARDSNANVREAALDALSRLVGHAADDEFVAALSSPAYQVVRVAARSLAGSPRGRDVVPAALAAAARLRADSSETSRDARRALLERIAEFATADDAGAVARLATDFDCTLARMAADVAIRLGAPGVPPGGVCRPMRIELPADAVALALGQDVRLRVVIADSSGGGAFTVRLRGDVAPLMAARVLALARAGYYNGLTWHRVEHDFVLQGGGPGANEYVGHPRFIRDEVGTVPHVRGTVGMSTRGHDTGDAQWFVNLRENLRLGRDYTVFAEVVDGIDVVDGILEGDVIARIAVVAPR